MRPVRLDRSPEFLATLALAALAPTAFGQMVWKEVKTKTSPPAMWTHAMAYDSARQRTVLFSSNGVYPYSPSYRETWEYDGLDWVKRKLAVSPTARAGHGMVYDEARRVVVMHGGNNYRSKTSFNETWEYDGITWVLRRPATRPPGGGHMVYDSLRRVTVLLIPGKLVSGKWVPMNHIWEWNGRNWRRRYVATTFPAVTGYDQGMVYDSARGVVCAVRGGNVWEWDGSKIGWRNRRVTGPPSGQWARIVYDEARRRTVWYGNSRSGNSVWEWDGTSWRRDPALFKPGRSWHSMVYDSKRQRVVLFSGSPYPKPNTNDTWEYYPTHRGTATPVGAGCAGSAGIPTLTGNGPPILGNREFRIRIDSANPDSLALVGFALKPRNLAIGGCTLFLDLSVAPILFRGRSNRAGTLHLPLPIPFNPALRGFRLEAQGFISDPKGTYFRILAFTNGLRLLIGD